MPVSGYSLTVLKGEAIDLNMTIEEAIQYLVSCGLVMPQKDLQRLRQPGLMTKFTSFRNAGQPVAQWQANWVAAQLRQHGQEIELIPITTSGDQQQTSSWTDGGNGHFHEGNSTRVARRTIDLAVHSLKDLPTEAVPGLALAAVPERAPVADVLVADRFDSLEHLPPGAVVGTGSLRRRAQLLHVRNDLEMRDIRGNVDTRLRKFREGHYEAIILAQAGLDRLGLSEAYTQVLPLSLILPAVGQGALGIETRADDAEACEAVACLDHAATHGAVTGRAGDARRLAWRLHGPHRGLGPDPRGAADPYRTGTRSGWHSHAGGDAAGPGDAELLAAAWRRCYWSKAPRR